MKAEKFANDRTLNLKRMGNGVGVMRLTIRNTGEADLIIGDVNEIIPKDRAFSINSDHIVNNEIIELKFDRTDPAKKKEAIVRYLVKVCE